MRVNRLMARGRAGRLLLGGLLVFGLAIVGCSSGSSMPKTYKVTGTVTYPGGKPVAGGAIQFMPVGDSSFLARGDIQDDGSYSLDMVKDNERKSGAPEGEYRVTVVPPIPPDQRTTPPFELPKTVRVEARDNQIPIEVTRKKS